MRLLGPSASRLAPCSPPSRTLRVATRWPAAILDRGCARRPAHDQAGTKKRHSSRTKKLAPAWQGCYLRWWSRHFQEPPKFHSRRRGGGFCPATQQHYAAATWPTFPPPRTITVSFVRIGGQVRVLSAVAERRFTARACRAGDAGLYRSGNLCWRRHCLDHSSLCGHDSHPVCAQFSRFRARFHGKGQRKYIISVHFWTMNRFRRIEAF